MQFAIEPYKKVGPLRFDMSIEETEEALEHIDRKVNAEDGVIELYNFSYDVRFSRASAQKFKSVD